METSPQPELVPGPPIIAYLSPEERWKALEEYINTWFYGTDFEALRCAIAAVRAHASTCNPVWLFIIGPSGSGKTAVVINSCSALPSTHVESNLSTRAFLSGAINGKQHSLLEQIGNGVLLFKDFTTLMSKREEDLKEIMSQLREIYDGEYSSKTGQRSPSWTGKITVIAAVTPIIEKAWSVHAAMGERFLFLKWPLSDPLKIAQAARQQIGMEKEIARNMRILTKNFYQHTYPTPKLEPEMGLEVDRLASCVAILRSPVKREPKKQEIIEAYRTEEPTRIAKSIDSIICNHAALFEREVSTYDFSLAKRIAYDNIPKNRLAIVKNIPDVGIDSTDLQVLSKLTEAQYRYYLEELIFLEVICTTHTGLSREIRFTKAFQPLWSF
jgi:hypothetical protein